MTNAAEFEIDSLEGLETGSPDDPGGSGAEHMQSFRAPDLEAEGGGADDVVHLDAETGEPLDAMAEVEQISKEAFFVAFRHSFGLPGMFSAQWKPLAIQPDETEIARDASDAIYELLEIYFPSALSPQSEMFARLSRAAPFILAKVMIVRMILEERRRAAVAAKQQRREGIEQPAQDTPQPANSDQPPAGAGPLDWMGQEQAA
ncbi:hypothetical protein MHM88_01660 [Epibacterium sp. MM17-32]|uniref:hypothetical protein n=1 Tax=Epibacterium sp. MM17-32 TaxID=2917734 RepID=UPI001EF52D9F|nr:hypothetical protein [Epibacterium sp. MM17-32]MCG7626496.1 hypothetical protein [Epibacterium sp. MM17-32]